MLLFLHHTCRKDDIEAGLMLLSQAKKDRIAPNLTMSRCIIGKYVVLNNFSSIVEPLIMFFHCVLYGIEMS